LGDFVKKLSSLLHPYGPDTPAAFIAALIKQKFEQYIIKFPNILLELCKKLMMDFWQIVDPSMLCANLFLP
jgi:hypothetical protein